MEKWVGKIHDIEKEFNKIDANGGGCILFDEFCDWAITKGLDLEDDFDNEHDDNLILNEFKNHKE